MVKYVNYRDPVETTTTTRPSCVIQELEQLMRPNTKLVVINFPHNPTGFIPTPMEFQQIIDLCREQGAYLFSDEMYRCVRINKINGGAGRLVLAVRAHGA